MTVMEQMGTSRGLRQNNPQELQKEHTKERALGHSLAKRQLFWKHQPTTEKTPKGLILDYFYFIKYTEQ